jgi:hypothetical protein
MSFPNLAQHIATDGNKENGYKQILLPNAQEIVDATTNTIIEELVAAGFPREIDRETGRSERGPFNMFKEAEHLRLSNGCFSEVPSGVVGFYNRWTFKRRWYYYAAEGDGIPPDIAEEFHKDWGRQVRVEGHCGCPSPLEWCAGFAVGSYHIDTPEGLAAFVKLLDRVYKPIEKISPQV